VAAAARAFCLSIHADYLCRHAGACCTSAWPIPVETPLVGVLRGAIASGRLKVPGADATDRRDPFLRPETLAAGTGGVLRADAAGACVFYERDSGLCVIHRRLGHEHLPSACQHFPRICLLEPHAVFVTLSHFCPTVARLPFRTDVQLAVVPAPARLMGDLRAEGLDARVALPPLVRPGLLADRESYRAWERFLIGTLGSELTPEAVIARVSSVTERIRGWTPDAGPLGDAVAGAIGAGGAREATAPASAHRSVLAGSGGRGTPASAPRFAWMVEAHELVRGCIPAQWSTVPAPADLETVDARFVAPSWPSLARPVRFYLGARAFASWFAYQGHGLRTIVRFLEIALAVVRVEAARHAAAAGRPLDEALLAEAFRSADLLLAHLADPQELAHRCSEAEE